MLSKCFVSRDNKSSVAKTTCIFSLFDDVGLMLQLGAGNNFAVVHCTGYIKNWPPQGIQMDRNPEEEMHASSSCCLVAIGRLQVHSSLVFSINILIVPFFLGDLYSKLRGPEQ